MIFKLLTYIILGYFAYQYFIKPLGLGGSKNRKVRDADDDVITVKLKKTSQKNRKGGDYVEYEEVD